MRSTAMGSGGGRGGETPQPAHRSASSGGGGSELFICFTARASTSMRAPSARSLASPGRNHREPAAPLLSASLSRRLRSSGSLKGGQSPMFPARKGCAFRAAEPSSPKVTCIGQVRVKSKAKNKGEGAAVRSRSDSLRRRAEGKSGIGEEETECSRNRNQSWVYQLPNSICEALRAVGSEFNCFLPCGGRRSPCFSSSRAREEKGGGGGGRGEKRPASSCGAVFVRWLMAIEESEEGEGGEMVGLVVGEREKRELDLVLRESEKSEVKVEEVGKEGGVEKKEEVVVVKEEVVCVPPKNALLLMRCRSDPVKMAALASRFFGSPATKVQAEEEDEEQGDRNEERKEVGKHFIVEEAGKGVGKESNEEVEVDAEDFSQETGEGETRELESQRSSEGVILSVTVKAEGASEKRDCEEKEKGIEKGGVLDESHEALSDPTEVVEAAETKFREKQHEKVLKDETLSLKAGEEKEEEDVKGKESRSCSSECNKEKEENVVKKETEETRPHRFSSSCKKEVIRRSSSCKEKERRRHSFSAEREARRHSFSTERDVRRASISVDKEGRICWSFTIEREEIKVRSEELAAEAEREKKKEELTEEEEIRKAVVVEKLKTTGEDQVAPEKRREEEEEGGEEKEEEEEEERREELPDCLLLMMYEPKLSMEVSRETWVCSTDFLHGHRHHLHLGHSSKGGRSRRSKGKVGVDGDGDGDGRRVKVDSAGDGKRVESKEVIKSIELSSQRLPPPPPVQQPVPPLPSAVVEQKLLSGVAAALVPACEPFVLSRCKSEPMRSTTKLAADGGFWKNRHRPIGVIDF